jgi:hypothetical protein
MENLHIAEILLERLLENNAMALIPCPYKAFIPNV